MTVISWCTSCISDAVLHNATDFINNTAHHAAHDVAVIHGGDLTWDIIAAACILLGLLYTFAGYGLFYITLATTGFIAASVISFGLTCGSSGSAIAALIVGCIVGILGALIILRVEKIGVILCGIGGGLAAYMYLNGFILTHLYDALPQAHQSYTPYLVAAALVVLGAALAHCLEKPVIIAATAIGGAYAIGFGVDRLAFANEHHNLNPLVLMSGGGCHAVECYVEFAVILLLAILGMIVQYKRTSREECETRFSKRNDHRSQYMPAQVYFDAEVGMPISAKERRVSREYA